MLDSYTHIISESEWLHLRVEKAAMWVPYIVTFHSRRAYVLCKKVLSVSVLNWAKEKKEY